MVSERSIKKDWFAPVLFFEGWVGCLQQNTLLLYFAKEGSYENGFRSNKGKGFE